MIQPAKNPALRQLIPGGMEKQKAFGWPIAWAIFFGGSAGGIFLVSYLLVGIYRYQSQLLQAGLILGPLLAIVCAAFFMVDLGNKIKMPRLFGDLSRLSSSWITRGALTLTVFILFGLACSLPFLPWAHTTLNNFFGLVAAVAAVVLVIYTGFLLGVVKSIPFWNNPLLPILFIVSGMGSGTAILLLIANGLDAGSGAAAVGRILPQLEGGLIVIQLIMLWAYLGVSTHRDLASAQSVRLIRTPAVLIIIFGLIVPAILLSASMEQPAALLELAGAFFLRFSILNAGVYLRLQAQ